VILRAAAELFAERGFESATVSDIAAGAGLTASSVYAHFRGKPELLLEVVRDTFAHLDMTSQLSEEQLETPAVLRFLVRSLLEPSQRTLRRLTVEVHHVAARNDQVRRLLDEYHRYSAAKYARMIETWQKNGLADPDVDAELTAQLFLTEALGLCNIDTINPALVGDERWLIRVEDHIDALLRPPRPAARKTRRQAV
jgi:AcrR family transcriptional regulator